MWFIYSPKASKVLISLVKLLPESSPQSHKLWDQNKIAAKAVRRRKFCSRINVFPTSRPKTSRLETSRLSNIVNVLVAQELLFNIIQIILDAGIY